MNKKPQKWHIAICIAFLLPIFAFFLISLTDTDKTFSKEENRNLSTRPELSFNTLLFGDFSENFEDYFSDTFPMRESLIGTSSVINRFYMISLKGQTIVIPGGPEHEDPGGQTLDPNDTESTSTPSDTTAISDITGTSETTTKPTESSPTYTSHSDTTTVSTPPTSWIPVTTEGTTQNGTTENGNIELQSGLIIYNGHIMERWYGLSSKQENYAAVMNELHSAMPNVNLYVMLCPTAIEMKSSSSYTSGSCSQLAAMNRIYSALDIGIHPVDVWSELYSHSNDYIYFHTDHHWTQLGAYYGYRAFCKASGDTPHELSEYTTHTYTNTFAGSLTSYVKNFISASRLEALRASDKLTYYLPINSSAAQRFDNQQMTAGRDIAVVTTNFKSTATVTYAGAFLQGDQPLIRITSDTVTNGRSILVVKESYANAFIPFLTDHFQTVYVVDPRYFNGSNQNTFDLYQFMSDNNVTDLACVNYSFSAQLFGSKGFMTKFKMMID